MLGFKSTYAEYLEFNDDLNAYLSTLGNEALWLKRCSVSLVSTLAARQVLCPISDNDTDETLIRLASFMGASNSGGQKQQKQSLQPASSASKLILVSRKIKEYILTRTDPQLGDMLKGISEPIDIATTIEKTFKLRRRREVRTLFSETLDRISTLRIKRDKRGLAIFVQRNLDKFRRLNVSLLDGCNALLNVDNIEEFEWVGEYDSLDSFETMFVPEHMETQEEAPVAPMNAPTETCDKSPPTDKPPAPQTSITGATLAVAVSDSDRSASGEQPTTPSAPVAATQPPSGTSLPPIPIGAQTASSSTGPAASYSSAIPPPSSGAASLSRSSTPASLPSASPAPPLDPSSPTLSQGTPPSIPPALEGGNTRTMNEALVERTIALREAIRRSRIPPTAPAAHVRPSAAVPPGADVLRASIDNLINRRLHLGTIMSKTTDQTEKKKLKKERRQMHLAIRDAEEFLDKVCAARPDTMNHAVDTIPATTTIAGRTTPIQCTTSTGTSGISDLTTTIPPTCSSHTGISQPPTHSPSQPTCLPPSRPASQPPSRPASRPPSQPPSQSPSHPACRLPSQPPSQSAPQQTSHTIASATTAASSTRMPTTNQPPSAEPKTIINSAVARSHEASQIPSRYGSVEASRPAKRLRSHAFPWDSDDLIDRFRPDGPKDNSPEERPEERPEADLVWGNRSTLYQSYFGKTTDKPNR
ncbi:YALIH222S10e02410g1_1 [Yarrowia lipolytica]|nr:YALIH222S10e02410g1_1 [Yarrowia lipolytica]